MPVYREPKSGDVRTVTGGNAERLEAAGWVLISDEAGEQLRGAALDAALEAASLSKAGTADEKRARLAEVSRAVHD